MTLSEKISLLFTELQNFLSKIDEQPALAIHEIRKRTKFMRALLKLNPEYSTNLKSKLGMISRLVAPYRDAQVNLETYQLLLEVPTAQPDSTLEAQLYQNPYLANPRPDQATIETIQHLLFDFDLQFNVYNSETSMEDLLGRAKQTFITGKKAFIQTQVNSESEVVHRWRKKTKKLWYQLRFLFGDELDIPDHPLMLSNVLGKLLGEIHDLDIFSSLLASEHHRKLIKFINERRQQLLNESFSLGEQLYSDELSMVYQSLQQQE